MAQHNRHFRSFFIIWGGQAVSLLGSQLVQFALIWWLTDTTQSATVLAMASLVGLLPQVVLGPFAGVLVDRWKRRNVLFAADTGVALATLLLGVLFWLDLTQIWHVFVILFVRSLAGSFHWPAMQASTTLMVPEEHLTRIQGLNQTLNGGMNIVSAPLGALLLAILPMQGIIAIDVVSALFAIVPLFFIAIPQPQGQAREATKGLPAFWRSFKGELGDGLRYVRGRRGLVMLIGLAVIVNLVLSPAFTLLPLLVSEHFQGGALQLGWVNSAFGIGIVSGGLLLGAWGGFRRRMVTSLCGLTLMGAATVVVGFTPTTLLWLAIAGMFVVGFSNSMTNGPVLAIVQSTVAPDMQGRVFTLLNSSVSLMTPVGLIIAGPIADWLGVQIWYVVGGFVTLLLAASGFLNTTLLSLDEAPAEVPVPTTPTATSRSSV